MLGIVVVLSSLGGRTVQAVDTSIYVPTYLKLWDSTTKTFADSQISSPLLVSVGDTITVGMFFTNNDAYKAVPAFEDSHILRSWQGTSYYFLSNDGATFGLSGLAWEKAYLEDDSVNSLLFGKPYSYEQKTGGWLGGTWDTIMTNGQWNNNTIDALTFDSLNYQNDGGASKYYVDHTKFLIGMLTFTVTEDMFNENDQFSLYNAGYMQWYRHNDGSSWTVRNSDTSEPWVLGTFQKAVVPEPGTYAMLCGLGLVGAAWYRRRQRKS